MNTHIQPSIEVLNIRIDEPITTLTDMVFAAICLYAFLRIRKLDASRGSRYFMYYFLILGLGALTGGFLGHAFLYRLSAGWKFVSWTLTLGSVALITSALMEIAKPMLKPGISRIIALLNLLFFVLALFFTFRTGAFTPVKYYMIFGMVVLVGALCYFLYRKTESRGVLLIMGAVGVGILSAIIFSFEWGLSPWFNHNDISHVILSFTAFGIYKGVVQILM